jgi:cell division septum initiation protein DivIVA
MRGYDIRQVDEVVTIVNDALKATEESVRESAVSMLRTSQFRVKIRGYSRPQVDNYIEHRILELSLPR